MSFQYCGKRAKIDLYVTLEIKKRSHFRIRNNKLILVLSQPKTETVKHQFRSRQ